MSRKLITQDLKYIDAQSLQETLQLLHENGSSARVIAGGVDIVSLLKENAIRPETLISIRSVKELNHVRYGRDSGLSIGSLARLSDLCESRELAQHYPILVQAIRHIGTPQIRNMGTIGGNLLQEVWCWYLRNGFQCWKAGGKGCPAAIGENSTYFSIMGGRLCMAACSSDIAPALLALDATARIQSLSNERILSIDKLLPGASLVDGKIRSNALAQNEILTDISVPHLPGAIVWDYQRFSSRECWDFPLVSVAVVASLSSGGSIQSCRVALGGVAPWPHRAREAEEIISESGLQTESASRAANAVAKECRSLQMNEYKVKIAQTLVERAIINASPSSKATSNDR